MFASCILLMDACVSLDRYPFDKLSKGTFWKTEEQLDQAIAGAYSELRSAWVYGRYFAFDCLGGVCSGTSADNSMTAVIYGTYSASYAWVTNRWGALYEGVARSNLVLQNIGSAEISDELRHRYEGEAKFLRALFYFELLKTYGGVPFYDESVVVAEQYNDMKLPRSTEEEIYHKIIADLKEAEKYLPEEGGWGDAMRGRATKSAATSLIGKVYLYQGKYQEASDAFSEVINSNKHSLYPDYAGLFKPSGDNSSEMIFAVQNLGGIGVDLGMPLAFYLGSRSTFGSCWDDVFPSTSFVDSYECIDGKPFNWNDYIPNFNENNQVKENTFRAELSDDLTSVKSYPEAKSLLLDMYTKRDPRMSQTVLLPYTMYKGWLDNAPNDCEFVIATGANEANHFVRLDNGWDAYLFRKFVPEYNMDGLITSRANTPINFPIIRYADVLLMKAECLAKLGSGNLEEALSLVNQVRERAGMPKLNTDGNPEWLKVDDCNALFDRIIKERAWEFAGEGLSFWDYKRWNKLERLAGPVKDIMGKTKYSRVVTGRDYLWPIPQGERDKNPKLIQNIGW